LQKYGLDDSKAVAAADSKPETPAAKGKPQTQGDAGPTRNPRLDVALLWKLRRDSTLEPVRIRTGITDHTVTEATEVLKGELKEGDELVTGSMSANKTGGPGMNAPRGR